MAEYDVLIIGAGQAGIPLARRLGQCGQSVALAERRHLGGSCVNFGCTPTKAVLASARVARLARRAAAFGLHVPTVAFDLPAVLRRARGFVTDSVDALRRGLADHHVTLLDGHARFTGRAGAAFTIDVAGQAVRARQVVLDTGTRTLVPEVPGLRDVEFLHAGNWLDANTLPRELVVVGASYIGLEMAQFYRTAGSQVCVVGTGRQVLPTEDTDVADALRARLERDGIRFRLGATLTSVGRDADRLSLGFDAGEPLAATHLFLATGRRPNTDDLGLHTIGLTPGDGGFLSVDERLATAVGGVWAAGDVRGGPMFTHASWDDHRVLESQLLEDGRRTTAGRVVPSAVFTDPELARVGMTEAEARRARGDAAVRVATFKMSHNGRAVVEGEPAGLIKLVIDVATDKLLGAAVLGASAGELIGSYVTLMNAGATLATIREGIYVHPTLTEAVQSAALEGG